MKRALPWMLLLMVPFFALGQSSGSLSSPTLGYVFDSDFGTLRPLVGIAGSSTVGAPIDLGFTISQSMDLPDQHNVLVAPDAGSSMVSIDMGANPPVSRPINGTSRSVSEISLSPHGTAAALSYRLGQMVQVVAGLPNKPAIALEITTSVIGLPLRRVVVNDDASVLMFSFAEGERETIYRWNRTEGFRLLASTVEVGALAFVGSTDVVFADSGTDEVFLAHNVNRQSAVTFLAGSAAGVSRPVGAGISSRNEIFVANGGSGTVMTFDSGGRMLGTQQCNCILSGLYPLGAGMFRLTDRFNQTIYILDSTGSENRILFVPPIQ